MLSELEERVRRLEEKMDRLVRVGVVTQVYPEKGSVRVMLPDADEEVSYELPVLVRKTLRDKDYWLPDVGEHVVCVFLPIGVEQGFVIGAFYSEKDKVPISSKDVKMVEFEDGAYAKYNRKEKKLKVYTSGDVYVRAKNVEAEAEETLTGRAKEAEVQADKVSVSAFSKAEITSPSVEILGDTKITGNFTVNGMASVSGVLNAGSINSSGTITGAGFSADESGVTVSSNLNVAQDLTVGGNANISGAVTCGSCNQAP